eukprot:6260644-Prymnesium_polylepis.1
MGPIRVSPQFLLCKLIGGHDERAAHVEIGMNLLESVAFDKLKFDDQLDAEVKEWHMSRRQGGHAFGGHSRPRGCRRTVWAAGRRHARSCSSSPRSSPSPSARSRTPTRTSRAQRRTTGWAKFDPVQRYTTRWCNA